MNTLKRLLGFIWILLALLSAYFSVVYFGLPKITNPKGSDDLVFGVIIIFILMPIIVGGLFKFGLYAIQGLYDDDENKS